MFLLQTQVLVNTISVGSIDGNKNISDYSSWNVNTSIEGILMNPTLVAPGGGTHYILLEAIEKLKEFLEKL